MKHPGTSGSLPIKGSGCGIRPDLDEMSEDTAFDFSAAQAFLDPLVKPEDDETLKSEGDDAIALRTHSIQSRRWN